MSQFQVIGTNSAALFTLKLHRGDGMFLLAVNWKKGEPPNDFVGFAIECSTVCLCRSGDLETF
jgi:hypothetical protein